MNLSDAIALAAEAHRGQLDKGGQPYVRHPLRVMEAVAAHGEEVQVVAVLHDALEDASTRFGYRELIYLAHQLSLPQRRAINALTRLKGEPYLTSYIARCAANPMARVVKLADLKDNLRRDRLSSPTPEDEARWSKYEAALKKLEAENG